MLAEITETASENAIRAEILTQMKGILMEKNLCYVQFYVKFVNEILPNTQTGKKNLIIKDTERMEAVR